MGAARVCWVATASICALGACGMDLDALRRPVVSAAPEGGSAPPDAADDPRDAMPAAPPRRDAGAPHEPPSCGVVGTPCCDHGGCTLGACLRGTCVAFGGLHVSADACAPACVSRNAYTAGCSCPPGFEPTPAMTVSVGCGSAPSGPGTLTLCTASRSPAAAWAGAWLRAEASAGCASTCLEPDRYTGACACPEGTSPIAMRASVVGSCRGMGAGTLTFCLGAAAGAASFTGAYQLDETAAGGCGAPNPETGACACPAGSTAQRLPFGQGPIFVCSH